MTKTEKVNFVIKTLKDLECSHVSFIDLSSKKFSEQEFYFSNYTHLNKEGKKAFTELLYESFKTLNQ